MLPRILACGIFAVSSAFAAPRTLEVPAQYSTIGAAVEAASPGDTVAIAPGRYDERLEIGKALTLRGQSYDKVMIYGPVEKGPLVTVNGVDGFRMEGVALEHTGRESENNRKYPDLLVLKGGNAEVVKCAFRNGGGVGVVLSGGGKAAITGCLAERNAQSGVGVFDDKSAVTLRECELCRNSLDGVQVGRGALIAGENNRLSENDRNGCTVGGAADEERLLRKNTCQKNRQSGICITYGVQATVEENTCTDNRAMGIVINSGARVSARGNTCAANENGGIVAHSFGTRAEILKNVCTGNGNDGIRVCLAGSALIAENTCQNNKRAGVFVNHWETTAEVKGNVCSGNGSNGLVFRSGSAGKASGNTCTDNQHYGILVTDEGSSAELSDNRLEGNQKGASETLSGKDVAHQIQAADYEMGCAFARGEFAYLERLVAKLRKNKNRNLNGGWNLHAFYKDIVYGCDELTYARWQPFKQRAEEWASAYPDSVAPRLVMAIAHKQRAWDYRGGGYANTVTTEGWNGWETELEEADRLCREADSKAERDPELYAVWIDIGVGRGDSREEVERRLGLALQIDPNYGPAYHSMAYYLWPRWHGSKGDMKALFNRVHEDTRAAMGEKIYAYVVNQQVCPSAAYGFLADWNILRPGFDQFTAEFPDSDYLLNRYCMFAAMFKDKEKAKELFARIGNTPCMSAWENSDKLFNELRGWAIEDKPFPAGKSASRGGPGFMDLLKKAFDSAQQK